MAVNRTSMPRTPSTETENRRLKTLLKSKDRQISALMTEIRDRRRFGGMLSNIAFNLAQKTEDKNLRAVLDECRKAWDEIKRVI